MIEHFIISLFGPNLGPLFIVGSIGIVTVLVMNKLLK